VAVRPVDVKGCGYRWTADPFDRYCEIFVAVRVDYEEIPWIESFVDHHRIKGRATTAASSLCAESSEYCGMGRFFLCSVRAGMTPYSEDRRFRKRGRLDRLLSRQAVGSNQAALSLRSGVILASSRATAHLQLR